ncbi:uncharacterized protein LOC129780431 isoform X1 [Toxorhynchites rutilus septentrionalis]|uniref:uncharacterized protein LOC129780431 isoform X1 n=1 Tax=Toxorhynchites rutilus septentrionalis TaxID=329112 RepID=UPI00247AEA2D|nr:uncharacterized protein LOC129780431 isoform X1 [Toxorhynchites rutilus septentrionalis]
MSCNTSIEEDINDEISSWGYSISLSDYEQSLQSEEIEKEREVKNSIVRGRGIACTDYMSTIRLASEINELKGHTAPMGHLPTSSELLESSAENEITPLLRKLGIGGHDGELDSRNTRKNPDNTEDIRLDGRVPVILNGDLFKIQQDLSTTKSLSDEDAPYDPNRPLRDQFSTIEEFQVIDESEENPTVDRKSISTCPKSSTHGSTNNSSDYSTTNDENFVVNSAENHMDEEPLKPLLMKKQKLYTPRQLYELKRSHLCNKYYQKVLDYRVRWRWPLILKKAY